MPGAASLLRHLDADATDADLLAAVVGGDDAAFASIVRRHGPMVLGVCRRVGGNEADAEDAFQATFLVLARKAGWIRQPKFLGNYLYGVAVRTSQAARRRRMRRREVFAVPDVPARSSPDAELAAVIDDGLAKLPTHYRDAILLCDLHELSRTEAATRLGIPEGTLSSRLAKGRAKLADILTRRGVTLSVSAISAAVAVPATAVPGRLMEATLAAVSGAGCAAAVLELTHEGAWPMRTKLATLATAGLLTAAGWAAVSGGEPPKAAEAAKPVVKVEAAKPAVVTGYGNPRMRTRIETVGSDFAWAPDGKTFHSAGWMPARGEGRPKLLLAHFHVVTNVGTQASPDYYFTPQPGVSASFVGPTAEGKYVAVKREESGINGTNSLGLHVLAPIAGRVDPAPSVSVPLDESVWGWHFLSPDVKFLLASVRPGPRPVPTPSPTIKPLKTIFRLFAVPSGDPVRTVFETDEWVWVAVVSKDFTRLATLSGTRGKTGRVFDIATGKKLWEAELDFIGIPPPPGDPQEGGQDRRPPTGAAAGKEEPGMSRNQNPLQRKQFQPGLPNEMEIGIRRDMVFSPDGKRLAVVNMTTGVRVLEADTGKKLPKWDDALDATVAGSYSFDGRLFAGVGGKKDPNGYNFLQVWDTTTGKLVKEWRPTTGVKVLFAPDRPTLAIAEDVANGNGLVRIGFWDFPAVK